jgi:hypothetical protein
MEENDHQQGQVPQAGELRAPAARGGTNQMQDTSPTQPADDEGSPIKGCAWQGAKGPAGQVTQACVPMAKPCGGHVKNCIYDVLQCLLVALKTSVTSENPYLHPQVQCYIVQQYPAIAALVGEAARSLAMRVRCAPRLPLHFYNFPKCPASLCVFLCLHV